MLFSILTLAVCVPVGVWCLYGLMTSLQHK